MTSSKTYKKIKEIDAERIVLYKRRSQWLFVYLLAPILTLVISTYLIGKVVPLIPIIVALLSYAIYYFKFTSPFDNMKLEIKKALIEEFMSIYHPSIDFEYLGEQDLAEHIISHSGLISADKYEEEDVIKGSKDNIDFRISEVDLKRKTSSKNGNSYYSIFKGILFKIKLKNRSFTKSHLFTNPSNLKKWFGSAVQNEAYGFWYESNNAERFLREMSPLFPFIKHLSQQGELRIKVKGDEVIILMESKMKFLDDPKPKIGKSFHDEAYYANMSQQLNSLLYIIDSFADELTPIEIEERLKLRVMEYAKNKS